MRWRTCRRLRRTKIIAAVRPLRNTSIGVRIEDDMLITPGGVKWLTEPYREGSLRSKTSSRVGDAKRHADVGAAPSIRRPRDAPIKGCSPEEAHLLRWGIATTAHQAAEPRTETQSNWDHYHHSYHHLLLVGLRSLPATLRTTQAVKKTVLWWLTGAGLASTSNAKNCDAIIFADA